MFIWKVSTILKCFEDFLPEIYTGLKEIEVAVNTEKYLETLKKVFSEIPSESIDYGIMEKAKNIYVIPGNFGWDDERINNTNQDRNIISGNVVKKKKKNSIIQGSKKLIATIGLEDIIIVDTDDALLICNKDNTQEVKEVIANLKASNKTEYL